MIIDSVTAYRLHMIKRISVGFLELMWLLIIVQIATEALYWPLVFLPALVPLVLVLIAAHQSIDVFIPSLNQSMKNYVYFVVYQAVVTVVVFAVLFSLKLENAIDASWVYVFIPVWYGLSIYFTVMCALLPGLLDNSIRRYREALLLVVWFVAFVTATVFYVA